MAGYLSLKMKRKDLEEVYDDFSDFSLSSPARKIRRLDAELPPIMEEEEPRVPLNFDQMLAEEQPSFTASMSEAVPSNEERALVLYNPMNTQLLKSPSSPNFTIMVNTDLIPGFKCYLAGDRDMLKRVENESDSTYRNTGANGNYLAVVPWVSSQSKFSTTVPRVEEVAATEFSEPMESEEVENEGMEIEVDKPEGQAQEFGRFEEGQQWQQQHCLTPQLPQKTATPVMWSW